MPSEIEQAGYQDFRRVVNSGLAMPDQWDWIGLVDDVGNVETWIEISADTRAEWITDENDQVQTVEIVVSGDDADISVPVTLEESILATTNLEGEARHRDTMTPATLGEPEDEVTIRHNIETPQV